MQKGNKTQAASSYPAGYAWLGLAAVYMGFLSVGFVFHFLPPILPVVIDDLGISHGQAGLLMSLFALPGILLSLPGGWLVDRYGERLVGSLGVVLMGGGTVCLGLAPSFTLILLSRALSGVGAMVGVVALQRLVIRLFAGRGLGLPVGISGSAIPVGIIIILNTAGPVAATSGWRLVALRAGGVTMVIGLVFALVTFVITRGRSLGRDAGQDDTPLAARGSSFRPIWIAGAVWFCANGAMTAFMTFAPDHFQGLGFSVSARGLFTSIPMWTSAALGMVTGWLTDRYGGRALFMTLGMALMGLALVLLPTAVLPPSVIGLLLGLSLAAVVTPTIALPGALLPPSHTGRGYGILATCANLGIFLVPPLAGWSRDTSGSYVWPFLIMGAAAFAGVVAAQILRRGRFTPGFSRRALVLVSVLLLAGCGSQDRYELADPVVPLIDETDPIQLTDMLLLLDRDGYGVSVGGAWSLDDIVVGDGDGRLVRLQGDLYTKMQLPVVDFLVKVVCRPDGSLLVATHDEGFWEWRAGTWHQLPALSAGNVRRVAVDHLGRIVAEVYDYHSTVWRLADGVWQQVVDDSWGRVDAMWAGPDQDLWLATETHNILRLSGDNAVVREDSLASLDNPSRLELVGDGTGVLACTDDRGNLWLRQAGVWQQQTNTSGMGTYGLFWLEGRLYGSQGWDSLVVWENGDWQDLLANVFLGGPRLAIPVAEGQLLLRSDSVGYLFDGQQVQKISPSINGLRGLAEVSGQMVVYTSGGGLFQIEDPEAGVWRFVGRTSGRAASNPLNALAVDDRGRLIAASVTGLEEWNGTAFSPLSREPWINYLQVAQDGEVLFASSDGTVGSLRAGTVLVEPFIESSGYSINGIWRRSPGVIDVLTRLGLYRLRQGQVAVPLWLAVGWEPSVLQVQSPEQAVVLGYQNARLITGDQVVDVTPQVSGNDGRSPVTINAACRLADGRLLAWSRGERTFLLRDDQGWHAAAPQGVSYDTLGDYWGKMGFYENSNHELFLYSESLLIRVEGMEGTE